MKETKTEKNEFCEEVHAHDETVQKVKASLSDADLLFDVAELFKIFGDNTRVNILATLSKNELCVCDVAAVLMTHNLTVLFMIYPISWVVTAAIYFIYLAVKKWDGMLDMTAEDRFIEKLRHIGKKKTA